MGSSSDSDSDSDSDEESGAAKAAELRGSAPPGYPLQHNPSGFMLKKGGFRKNWNRRWWVLDAGSAELAYYDDEDRGDRKGAINLYNASEVRTSTFESAKKVAKSREMELVTSDRTWRMRAESKEELEAWTELIGGVITRIQKTQGMTPAERIVDAGLSYILPTIDAADHPGVSIPWLGEPPRKSSESSKPVTAQPMEEYGLHGSVRKLKICVGWWL